MKTLAVHIHLYYTAQLPEILNALKSLEETDYDLFVTVVRENKEVEEKIKAFNKNARLWVVPNRGYDIGPFIDFLHKIDLAAYEFILKIHTKGTEGKNYTLLNGNRLDNKLWKQILLDALLKDKKRVRDNLAVLKRKSQMGILSSGYCITSEERAYKKTLSGVNEELTKLQFKPVRKLRFVAGTMFYARSKLLKPLLKYRIDDFEKTDGTVKEGTLAHVIERLIGCISEHQGYTVYGIRHDKYTKRFFVASLKRFLYQKKQTDHRLLIKFLKIPIYSKLINKEVK